MNINSLTRGLFEQVQKHKNSNKLQSTQLKFDHDNKLMGATSLAKNDLIAQFWGMTNKMPKKDQISLAASVIASKVFKNGMTPENKAFIKNIKNKFSPDEIGNLESQVRTHPMMRGKAPDKVSDFMKALQQSLDKNNSEIGSLDNNKPLTTPRLPEEIFFQTTLKFGNFNKPAMAA